MAKEFDPLEYNYELVHKEDGVFHFQKSTIQKDCIITDIIELAYWSKQKTWIIFIECINLKPFFKQAPHYDENFKISLFVGEIKNDFDFQLLMKRICIDPEILIQLGC